MLAPALWPDLTEACSRRASGFLVAKQMTSGVRADVRVLAFLRIVDGTLLDYQLAREAYFTFWTDGQLGAGAPVSERLVPYVHHIENMFSNLLRALLLCDCVRCIPVTTGTPPLVEKLEWRTVNTVTDVVRRFRVAIQHADEKLQAGELTVATITFENDGVVALGAERVRMAVIADALRDLHTMSLKVVERLPAVF